VFRSGYLRLGKIRGAVVRAHWSVLLGAIIFGGFRFDPWFLLGFVVLVLLHELGHAVLVWRYGHRVQLIEVTGLGGACGWDGNATPYEEAAIAWGGVLAQGLLLAGAYAWPLLMGAPTNPGAYSLLGVFTTTNLWLIAINLMPLPPLDGAKAWKFFALWRERRNRGGVPHGSWLDPSPNAQRAWLDRVARKSKAQRPKPKVPVQALSFDIPDDAKPSRDAQRAIDDLLKRAQRRAEEEKD